MHRRRLLATAAAWPLARAGAQAFDHGYAAWEALLARHVRWLPDGKQSRVAYAGLLAERAALQAVLAQWSAVPAAGFAAWGRAEQIAFLVNAYNGFTIELVLTRYPGLKSIKDIGSFVQSPWKRSFFSLLGEPRHLDWIEHEQLRPKYQEPRVHAAIVCASIGCPALRPEAFTAARLEEQLEDGMRRFLADRSRNRVAAGRLEVSAIFKWFREDFERGHQGFHRVEDVFARYAPQLSDDAAVQQQLKARALPVRHLEYDWALNDAGRG